MGEQNGRSNYRTRDEIVDLIFKEEFFRGVVGLVKSRLSFALSELSKVIKNLIHSSVISMTR